MNAATGDSQTAPSALATSSLSTGPHPLAALLLCSRSTSHQRVLLALRSRPALGYPLSSLTPTGSVSRHFLSQLFPSTSDVPVLRSMSIFLTPKKSKRLFVAHLPPPNACQLFTAVDVAAGKPWDPSPHRAGSAVRTPGRGGQRPLLSCLFTQEATVRTRHGTTDWFKTGEGV